MVPLERRERREGGERERVKERERESEGIERQIRGICKLNDFKLFS